MNVHLGSTLDKFVTSLLRSGLYQSQSEVLREALRLLKEREEARDGELARLRRQIAIGARQAERGQLFDGEAVFAQLLKRRTRQRRNRK
jgi:antitoxin ParD1/3/4